MSWPLQKKKLCLAEFTSLELVVENVIKWMAECALLSVELADSGLTGGVWQMCRAQNKHSCRVTNLFSFFWDSLELLLLPTADFNAPESLAGSWGWAQVWRHLTPGIIIFFFRSLFLASGRECLLCLCWNRFYGRYRLCSVDLVIKD